MVRAKRIALILLAAGRSARFGTTDKLMAELEGKPLALHAVRTVSGFDFAHRLAVMSGTKVDFGAYGFEIVQNGEPERGMGHSLSLGIQAVACKDIDAVLVMLADMPRVTSDHIARLLTAGNGELAVVASSDGKRPMPPALFGARHFGALAKLSGDQGARELIRHAHRVEASPDVLIDVDTPEDLVRAAIRAARHQSD